VLDNLVSFLVYDIRLLKKQDIRKSSGVHGEVGFMTKKNQLDLGVVCVLI